MAASLTMCWQERSGLKPLAINLANVSVGGNSRSLYSGSAISVISNSSGFGMVDINKPVIIDLLSNLDQFARDFGTIRFIY
jgi:hypothetical protein